MYSVSAETSAGLKPARTWIQRLLSGKRWRAHRQRRPPLTAFSWNGAAPAKHCIRDISESGLYLLTSERWYPRTLIMMTLQREDASEIASRKSITVQAMVIRSDSDGVAFAFVPPEVYNLRRGHQPFATGADRATLQEFLRNTHRNEA
jgi:hypothetical protein